MIREPSYCIIPFSQASKIPPCIVLSDYFPSPSRDTRVSRGARDVVSLPGAMFARQENTDFE